MKRKLVRSAILTAMEGLRFVCQPHCTNCCRQAGFVYITEHDLRQAAAFVGMTPEEFESKYVYRTKHLLRLRKPRNSQCQFLLEGGCAIHPAKPTQCRAFPFWPELVGSRASWRKTAAHCPGIGQGPLIPVDAVIRIANEMREAYPTMHEG
jgi:Fe-S-cluster containining protein